MKINWSRTKDISNQSGTITEPVSVQEQKDYMRLAGWVDDDESSSTDLSNFTLDDTLIGQLITTAREQFEQKCGLSLIPKTLKSVITNECGMIEIPYGPVESITSLKDSSNNDLAYTLVGFLGDFINLKSPCQENMVLIREAGYGNSLCGDIPKSLKTDIMRYVSYLYDNRGNEEGAKMYFAQLYNKYSRNTWIQ